ncbi:MULTISPECIES: 4-hydroxy-tetrahydrodipicolinate synthase [Acidithiobacillus]|jgi:4-hydroxy-tetrahydrodipicolinate synthase|uniref:4-hydroxy-tetrahydrodipicolinate synthase n=2 Tax=Acidithiobacillus TaxID=119977 RepID=A0A179B9V8_ACIFR|nr:MULTISPECIES: 4-hydroxy-tetrahydrodipicolinate synthase [Acidithiobacillus]MDA8152806.1 4-hydroxy-tetrahydrodipicolinate synthase [Acidithiobacillus sp.]MBU2831471.1 4-hydroxy-tetrahydrodipicolinate synthase [Acidithiobacillus ferriphilus]MBU2832023.1 4-hydroxy-tetrahydrodipicolinate synthase [Acidithiobacillus ferriphilus]MBU2853850.1 4-hydroxy-tetrahydrodipicolinate synthase [Acidithiobacillus ferriphilus]MBW9248408.1 4-hydroxy-tetrahydrodipicolinate synthase [Acidithiobacillus ferriphilu
MFHGSMVALVTPMRADGVVDDTALRDLVEWHIAEGTHALVAVGTTGESATLEMREHVAVIRTVVEQVKGRIPVIAGTGANATYEAIELTRAAMEVKADAALLVSPYYNKPTQEGLFQHYSAIAEQCHFPMILYNVPGRTAGDILPETVARLAPRADIIGIKEASGKVERVAEILALCGDQVQVYSGDDGAALAALALGARGVISVTANVAPRLMARMCDLALAGDFIGARAVNAQLVGLHRDLFLESNPIPVKWALHEMGRMGAALRLPLTPFSSVHHERLRESLRRAQCV